MATYSRSDRLVAIQKAGFANPLTALSVSLAEFGENRDVNAQAQSDFVANGVREPSFGPWQIHLPSHPDVTQSCAMDLACSTQYAAKLSKGGTDFSAWSAFTNGSYKTFLDEISGPIKALATPAPTPPSASGGTGTAGPSGGASGTASCGLDALSILEAGNRLKAGESPAQIAAEFTKELGRPITVECLQGDAYKVAKDVGDFKIPGEDAVKGLTGGLGGLTKFTDLLKSENLWRAAFVIVGVGAVFIGGRMYLRDEAPSADELNIMMARRRGGTI